MDTSKLKADGAEKNSENPGQDSKTGPEQAAGPSIQELQAELKDKDAKYLYLYAEFENFKKRAFKEKSDAAKFGWDGVASELLQVVDNLERAIQHMPANVDKNLAQGIQLVLSQFKSTMQKNGVQEIDSLKKPFDPNFHEAVGQEPSPDPIDTITQVHQKGYTLHGRLLRPARVMVSSGPMDGAKA